MFTEFLNRIYRPLLFLTAICALLAIGLPATPANSQAATFVDVAGGDYEQIEVTLRADSAPAPGGIVNFTFAATPLRDAPDLTITWELPDGGVLLGGAASESLGVVAAGQTVQQVRQVQFAHEGSFEVRAAATYHPDAATTLTAHGVLFFTVDIAGSTVSDGDPRTPRYTPLPVKPTIDKSATVVAADAWGPDVPQGCFTVTGVLTREERQPAANPPRYVDQLGSARPVHHILVEMREEDTISDDSYGHTVTDDNGRFEFRFCDDDGAFNDELELYYRVCSEVWDGSRIARIEQTSEQELYCWDSGTKDSEGGTVDFDVAVYRLNQIQSMVFNIADALYYARKFWNDNTGGVSPFFDRSVRVFWEAGRKQTGSFYNDDRSIMVIADDASSFDQWDDSVIIHEWGHFADHQFSCNQNPGGAHTLPGNNLGPTGRQLSWGEGYPDYYQSAARTIMPGSGFTNFYIDVNGPTVDFETLPGTASDRNEGAIAALLWDFLDAANDGSDTVSHGQTRIQQVYTTAGFQGNTQCDMRRFLQVWKDLSLPTDAQTAATVVQNTGINNPFAAVAAASTEPLLTTASAQTANAADPLDYRWWDQVTMVVDNSNSMAGGGPPAKLDAVKAVIGEQVNDYTRNPLGTEFNLYTFNAGGVLNSTMLEGRFFPNDILPAVNGLVASGVDAGCYVNALNAMRQAVQNKYKGHAWVYTDGESTENTSVEFLRQVLNQRRVHGSFVLLQGCNSLPTKQSDVTGAEKNYLGLAANGSQPGSIVPYLLTAIGSGGQFLFVAPNQLANAVDILRAQLSHSAGAGRWSDYVSDFPTYRWDKLTSWEYRWIDTSLGAGGAFAGQPYNKSIRVNLPQAVSIYGNPATHGWVQDDGYILMGDALDAPTLDVLYAPLEWQFRLCGPNVIAASPTEVPCNTDRVEVYTKEEANWFAITTQGVAESGNPRAYQALLDAQTGELRYQYRNVEVGDVGKAEIAVSDIANNRRTLVSNKDVNGASNGMGYKFTPAPPQPTKSYTVETDALMQGVGFLTTGYSGSLDPMLVQYPDGTTVDCNDTANVLCLNLNNGLVQYVQVNVNGRTGIYTASISAGPTGEGTFSFNALAASAIRPASRDKRLVALKPHIFHLDLGRTADGNTLQGWLQRPNGARFGDAFTLYDDGAHDDDTAGDGLFGSDAFTPPAASVGYLWVRGTLDGVEITRSDPTPFNFQPIDVQPEQEYVQGFLGSTMPVVFLVTNQDSVRHCYRMEVNVPAGWNLVLPDPNPCVEAGATNGPYVFVDHPLDNQAGGVTGEVSATFTEVEEGRISGGASATVAFFRPLKSVAFDNRWTYTYLRPNNTDTVSMTVNLLDDQGQISGWSGGLGYQLTTTLGTVTSPTDGRFDNGRLPIVFTAGTQTGEALITFVLEGSATATTTMQIRNPVATQLDLVATPTDLRGSVNSSALVVTLRDAVGDPVVGQTVRLSVSDDDGNQGTVNGGEVFTATTDANGQVNATFTKSAGAVGTVAVRAESLRPDAAGLRVTHEALAMLTLSDAPPVVSNPVYLPLIRSAGQAQATSLMVFDEALADGWENWSWDSAVDLAQASLAHSGSRAIAVTYNAASAGLSLRAPDPISTNGYTALQFWVYGSGGGNALLAYTEAGDEGPISPAQHAFTAPPNGWTQITVPLSVLGNPSVIKRITIQENGGSPQPTLYVDEVRLVGN